MLLRKLSFIAAIAALTASTSLAEIIQYNLEATAPDGSEFTAVAFVETETPDLLEGEGSDPSYSSSSIFVDAVTEATAQSVGPDGTIRNFALSLADPESPEPINSGGITFVAVGSEDPADSAVCVIDFAGDGSDPLSPDFFGLPANYAGAGVIVAFNAIDQDGVTETLLFGFACEEGVTLGEMPTQTLPGDCVGYVFVTNGDLSDSANIKPAVFTVGAQNPTVPEQIDGIVDSVVDLYNDGGVSYFGAVSILFPVLTAEIAYENGLTVTAYWQLRRARSAVRRLVRRGGIEPVTGQALIDSINASIDSLVDEILG